MANVLCFSARFKVKELKSTNLMQWRTVNAAQSRQGQRFALFG